MIGFETHEKCVVEIHAKRDPILYEDWRLLSGSASGNMKFGQTDAVAWKDDSIAPLTSASSVA